MRPPLVVVVIGVLALAGCAQGTPGFPAGAAVDYQLGGAYPPPSGVTVVTRDSTAQPAEGLYSICYVNGFQSQPGVEWPAELLLMDASGEPVIDENWPDETVLDISTEAKRAAVAEIIGRSIETCAASGFDAVEFDNLDSYTRSRDLLTLEDAVAFATIVTRHAHDLGLAVGQKNTGELGDRGRDEIGFDFAVVEECDQFEECAAFTEVYGDAVIDIEYMDALRRPFEEACADPDAPASMILRDRDLSPAGSVGYVYERC